MIQHNKGCGDFQSIALLICSPHGSCYLEQCCHLDWNTWNHVLVKGAASQVRHYIASKRFVINNFKVNRCFGFVFYFLVIIFLVLLVCGWFFFLFVFFFFIFLSLCWSCFYFVVLMMSSSSSSSGLSDESRVGYDKILIITYDNTVWNHWTQILWQDVRDWYPQFTYYS